MPVYHFKKGGRPITINELLNEQETLRQIRKHHIQKLIAWDNPTGILLCHKHKNWIRWQRRELKDGKAITTDLRKTETELAEKLAVNLYRIICIQTIQKQLNDIDKLIRKRYSNRQSKLDDIAQEEESQSEPADMEKNSPGASILAEGVIRKLFYRVRNCPGEPADFFHVDSPYRQLIIHFLRREYAGVIDWYNGDFEQNQEHPENLLYEVKLGYKVRSKSEVLIADRLYDEGILFHYEELLYLTESDPFPDFYILLSLVKKYIWEHFGAMDKNNYFHRTKGRVLNYMDSKWFPGINMVTTYETKGNPLEASQVDQKVSMLKTLYRLAFPDLPPDESFNMYDLADYAKLYEMED